MGERWAQAAPFYRRKMKMMVKSDPQTGRYGGRTNPFLPLGDSAAFRKALDLAGKVAPTDAPVLLTGEEGTGKEMIAHFMHRQSPRRERPFIPVNCALLPGDLVEFEIFGEAANSGSSVTREPGLIARARGGTLLLDDVDHLPPPVQVRILRMIENRTAGIPLPSRAGTGIDLRIMATLTRSAQSAVEDGSLRRDLFYRLAVFPIELPPLRERADDIPLLARHFLTRFWRLNRKGGGEAPLLVPPTLDALKARPWFGNVRELQHVMERIAVLFNADSRVRPADLPEAELAPPKSGPTQGPPPRRSETDPIPERRPTEALGHLSEELLSRPFSDAKSRLTEEFEREYLTRLIRRAGGNMATAAELGGVNKTTLYRLLQKYSISKEDVLRSGA